MSFRDRGIEIKTPDQIAGMRRAGLVVGQTLELLRDSVRPGITTGELDAIAEGNIRSSGATPSFKGYHGFPGSICASVNDEVVHGIPGARVLAEGDVVSIDCGAIVDGWHGDAAITVAVGEVPAEVTELMRVTEEAMWRGIAAARLGGRVTDISHAVESHVRAATAATASSRSTSATASAPQMHQPPNVPNYGRPGRGSQARRGAGPRGRADGDPRRQADRGPRGRLDGRHRRRQPGPRTSSTRSRSPPRAPGCSPRSTAARPPSPRSGSLSAAGRL